MNLFKAIYKSKSPAFLLGLLIILVLSGAFITSSISYGIFFLIYDANENVMLHPSALRFIQFISSLGTFLIPALIIAQLCSSSVKSYLFIKGFPSLQTLCYATICLLLLSPIITLTSMLNMQMKLPEIFSPIETWMITQEETMKNVTELLIGDGSLPVLIANLIVIALTAGLTEEFFFRGVIQRIIEKITTNHHLVIWLTAILFSAFHLQFYGFIPRMILGAFLGYLLYWGQNIWIPVFTHFMNNAIAVVGMSDKNLKESEFITGEITDQHLSLYIIMAIISLILFYYCYEKLKKRLKKESSKIFLA